MSDLPVIKLEGRVLPTLESDGSRRWLRPRLAKGRFWYRRRVVAYVLIAVYTLLPFVPINGRPALQIDLLNGRFFVFGAVFLPTDLRLLAVLGLMGFLTIFFATAVFGRVWCGWACPQTVYMEYVFRPIERLCTGVGGRGGPAKKPAAGWRIAAMYVAFVLIAWHLCNTFLAYFVGAGTLHDWIWTAPPWRHPGAFTLVAVVTVLMLFNFGFWREQLCAIGCPYGRFQSVMLDESSLVVGYDQRRGEPRGRGGNRDAKGLGDCVDCHSCVKVCPMGIDIRDGLQMECVNCTQCIDACDEVMDRLGKPRGLVRYSSQSGLEGNPTKILRPRVIIYSALISLLGILLVLLLVSRSPFKATLLRGLGAPYSVLPSGEVDNLVRIKLVNRTDEEQSYEVSVAAPPEVRLSTPLQITLPPQGVTTDTLHCLAAPEPFYNRSGTLDVTLRVSERGGVAIDHEYRLFGPAAPVDASLESRP
ncbi:MAG: cytochrome c oxidase accessory protein CcoG [Planctomycetota bacterium]